MSDDVFFDTSVLVYALARNDGRADKAEELLASGGVVSVQVLNEFVAVARRKLRLPWQQTEEAVAAIRSLCKKITNITVETHEEGLRLCRRYNFQVYDGLIVAAASLAGCKTLYSEDMQHGQIIGALRIVNPFEKTKA